MRPEDAHPAENDDRTLLRRFAGGERAALSVLARRHEPAMLALARGLFAGDEDAGGEAVQRAWVRVIRHARTYRGEGDARAWLLRIVVNACRDELARRRRERVRSFRLVREPERPLVDGVGDEWSEDLRRAVAGLEDRKREALVLCYGLGLSREAAAAVLGIPTGTVKTRVFAALRELRERLSAWDEAGVGAEGLGAR